MAEIFDATGATLVVVGASAIFALAVVCAVLRRRFWFGLTVGNYKIGVEIGEEKEE